MPPNVYPTSIQRLPDVILCMSFTRPSTALGDWRPGNETTHTRPPQLASLIPRLPCSGTQTLKLCRCGDPSIFLTWEALKDRRKVDATLIVRGCMRLRTEKGTKVADNLLHISSYRASNIIHTERWSVVSWQRAKHCLWSVFVLFWLRHAYIQKIPGSPCDTYLRSGRAWERGYGVFAVVCM